MRTAVISSLFLILVSCSENDSINDVEMCKSVSVNSFSQFLNISNTTKESDLKKILGKAHGGSFTDDKLVFIYRYEGLDRVPISAYVNSESGKVQTISMEVLGLNKNFDNDIEKAVTKYIKNPCQAIILDKTPTQVIGILGSPPVDNITADNVESEIRTLRYKSDSGDINLRLNFYPSQNYRLSSIIVDWY